VRSSSCVTLFSSVAAMILELVLRASIAALILFLAFSRLAAEMTCIAC
jgi:hypothetical protein